MEDAQKIAPCGYNCSTCPSYPGGTKDEAAIENMAKRVNMPLAEFKKMEMKCPGCCPSEGKPHSDQQCPTYVCCVENKKLSFCSQCDDFPCLKLAPISKQGDVRPHNSKVYNLLMLKKLGIEKYLKEGDRFWVQLARGKTPIPGDDIQV